MTQLVISTIGLSEMLQLTKNSSSVIDFVETCENTKDGLDLKFSMHKK